MLLAVHVTLPAVLTATFVGATTCCGLIVIVIVASFAAPDSLSVAVTTYVYIPAGVPPAITTVGSVVVAVADVDVDRC